MRYVHVASKAPSGSIDFNSAIMANQGLALYSIIEGMRQRGFNTHTLNDALMSIKQYNKKYVQPCGGELLIDSGGYSIIKGEVHPTEIFRFVQCYNTILRLEIESCDRIFSLDIPWSKVFSEMNSKQKITEFNAYSLSTARAILLENPVAAQKFSFVWHFKMQAQYEIWKGLYNELSLNDIIRNRAIGGMVALRGITGIKFSPFIGIAYRCLLDYLDAKRFDHPFSLHYLGMYLPYDRFAMALLDALFTRYVEGQAPVITTYDSINPSHSARMNPNLAFFRFNGEDLLVEGNLMDAPGDIIRSVYGEAELIRFVEEEMDRRRNGEKLVHAGSFAPLNIYSHRQLDLYFEHVVDTHELAELFFRERSLTAINWHVSEMLECLVQKHPMVFSKSLRQSIMQNIGLIFQFHRWFADDRGRRKLEGLIAENIRRIGFPATLS